LIRLILLIERNKTQRGKKKKKEEKDFQKFLWAFAQSSTVSYKLYGKSRHVGGVFLFRALVVGPDECNAPPSPWVV
jgi:hypothetical protein